MFDWLYRALGAMLSFFNSITGSYALALLFYALVFKLLFVFFSIKQQKNQIAMAKLTPKMEAIKRKYKGATDRTSMQRQQEELMELQQKEGFNPLSGCLPLLIQLPIIMLLYAVIQNPLSYIAKTNNVINEYNDNIKNEEYIVPEELANDPLFGDIVNDENKKKITQDDVILKIYRNLWDEDDEAYKATSVPKNVEIKLISKIYEFVNEDSEKYPTKEDRIEQISKYGLDYETIPNFNVFGVNVAETPSFTKPSILIIIPILAAISSWLSMFLMRKMSATGQMQQDAQTRMSMGIMDLVMPLMTLFISFSFSGMLGIYWIYQSLLGLAQQFILSKAMPIPKFTEEELKEIEKMNKEADKEAKKLAKSNPKHKSLHYIDEDDFDELPEVKKNNSNKNKKDNIGSQDFPEIKD